MSRCPFSPVFEAENCDPNLLLGGGKPLLTDFLSPDAPFSSRSILKPSTRDNFCFFDTPPPTRSLKVTFQTPILTPKVDPLNPFPYEAVRELDVLENWSSRAEVIFQTDHQDLLNIAGNIVKDLVEELPLQAMSPPGSGVESQVKTTTTVSGDNNSTERPLSNPSQILNKSNSMSEEIPIPKSGKNLYELTDEDMEKVNPFSSSNKMENSPPIKASVKSIYNLSDEDLEKMNPFATKSAMQNSPPTNRADFNANATHNDSGKEPNEDTDDISSVEVVEASKEDEKKDEVKESTPEVTLPEKSKAPSTKPSSKKPTRLKGPKKTKKKLSPLKEGVQLTQGSAGNGEASTSTASGEVSKLGASNEPSTEAAVVEQSTGEELQFGGDSATEKHFDTNVLSQEQLFGQHGDGVPEITDDEFRSGVEVFANNDQAALDIDFLEKMGQSNNFQDSALARQSLYVKFDPLMKDLNQHKTIGTLPISSIPPAILEENDLLVMTTPSPKTKPNVGVHPTINKAVMGVDKLLSYSPSMNDTGVDEDETVSEGDETDTADVVAVDDEGIVQPLRYSQADLEAAIETKVHHALKKAREEANAKYAEYEKQLKENDEQQKSLDKSNAEMRNLMVQYENATQQLVEDIKETKISHDDKVMELQKIIAQTLEDMSSVENAFSDLHKRYEKLKATVQVYQKNEDVLKKCVDDHQVQLKKREHKYQTLKIHAEDKIKIANGEIDKVKTSYGAEISGLKASQKRDQMKLASMERTIAEKIKENTELTNLCDELISRVGGGGSH